MLCFTSLMELMGQVSFNFPVNHCSIPLSGRSLLILWPHPPPPSPWPCFLLPLFLSGLKVSPVFTGQAEGENCQVLSVHKHPSFGSNPMVPTCLNTGPEWAHVQTSILWPNSCWPRCMFSLWFCLCLVFRALRTLTYLASVPHVTVPCQDG